MKRPRIITATIEISSSDIKARVEVKTNTPIVLKDFTFITPNETLPGKCFFTWIERIKK